MRALKLRASGSNGIRRMFNLINGQLDNIQEDIRSKRNPRGEGMQSTVKTIGDLQEKLRKQQADFNTITERIDSALMALTECDEEEQFLQDADQLNSLNNK